MLLLLPDATPLLLLLPDATLLLLQRAATTTVHDDDWSYYVLPDATPLLLPRCCRYALTPHYYYYILKVLQLPLLPYPALNKHFLPTIYYYYPLLLLLHYCYYYSKGCYSPETKAPWTKSTLIEGKMSWSTL